MPSAPSPTSSTRQKFTVMAQATASHLRQNHRYPKATGRYWDLGRHLSPEERRLGAWLERVRLREAGKGIPEWQKEILDDILPGWFSTRVDDWTSLLLVNVWQMENRYSHHDKESAASEMWRMSRYDFLKNELSAEKVAALDNYFIDWEVGRSTKWYSDNSFEDYFREERYHLQTVYADADEPLLTDLKFWSIRAQTFLDRQARRYREGNLAEHHLGELEHIIPTFRAYEGPLASRN